MSQKKSRIVTYDTMDEDEATLGLDGCNGVIQVLIEPIDPGIRITRSVFCARFLQKGKGSAGHDVFTDDKKRIRKEPACSWKKMRHQEYIHRSTSSSTPEGRCIHIVCRAKIIVQKLYSENLSITAFIEYIPPVISVVIIGAGNDVFPLVDMAEILVGNKGGRWTCQLCKQGQVCEILPGAGVKT